MAVGVVGAHRSSFTSLRRLIFPIWRCHWTDIKPIASASATRSSCRAAAGPPVLQRTRSISQAGRAEQTPQCCWDGGNGRSEPKPMAASADSILMYASCEKCPSRWRSKA